MAGIPQGRPATLQCLGGAAAPQELVAGWQSVLALPAAALAEFTRVLRAGLCAEPGDGAGAVRALAAGSGTSEADLGAALSATGFVLRQASRLDLDDAAVAADLAALSFDHARAPAVAGAVLESFRASKASLRQQALHDALADHGKLLVGLNWRVDKVTASDRGLQFAADVVFLTLVCRDQAGTERVTLQLTPTSLQALKAFCQRFD
jgi:hypothetical protein